MLSIEGRKGLTNADPQTDLFKAAMAEFGPALGRLVRGYERDPGQQADLMQEIQVALWRSLAGFDGRCSLRTWAYRVAHNVAVTHIVKSRRRREAWVSLEAIGDMADREDTESIAASALALERMRAMIRRLRPPDAQIMLLWLEGEDAASISEVTGVTTGAIATKIHRLKAALARHFQKGGPSDD